MRLFDEPVSPRQLSPLTLAFVGDAVYELLVREFLACEANRPVHELNRRSTEVVRAGAQAQALKKIASLLSEEEQAVVRRGRNAHPNHSAKNASVTDYRLATGLEALFGYLYLSDRTERIRELFDQINGLTAAAP